MSNIVRFIKKNKNENKIRNMKKKSSSQITYSLLLLISTSSTQTLIDICVFIFLHTYRVVDDDRLMITTKGLKHLTSQYFLKFNQHTIVLLFYCYPSKHSLFLSFFTPAQPPNYPFNFIYS